MSSSPPEDLDCEQLNVGPSEPEDILEYRNMSQVVMGETGPLEPLKINKVELILKPTRRQVSAGEEFSVVGRFCNYSDASVWLVDMAIALCPPTEIQLYGGSGIAFFPSIISRGTPEVVRLERHSDYSVRFIINRLKDEKSANTFIDLLEILRKAASTLKFLFFRPGVFVLTADAHVFPEPPRLVHIPNELEMQGEWVIGNMGNSYTITSECEIEVGIAQTVLIFGTGLGGLLMLAFQAVSAGGTKALLPVPFQILSTLILCIMVTILISRLSNVDFIISLKINDFWGAIAAGVVIQYFGQQILRQLLMGS